MLISLMLTPAGKHRWGTNYVRQQGSRREHFRRGNAVCVLIVEDEPIILLTIAAWLEDARYRVMTANDGLHAVDLLEQNPGHFSALVTDFHMPLGMTGAHVVMHIAARLGQ